MIEKLETVGNGSKTLSVEVLAEEAVDDGVRGAVAVAEELKYGEDGPSDRATVSTAVPQQVDLHTTYGQ